MQSNHHAQFLNIKLRIT